MAFDTFDEGIIPGGMRSKYEIRILICYLLNSIKEPVSKEIIVDSICEESLANYFETSSCFDDLIEKGNIIEKGTDGDVKTSPPCARTGAWLSGKDSCPQAGALPTP